MKLLSQEQFMVSAETAAGIAVNKPHYHESYAALLRIASMLEDDKECKSFIALACTAYGWMPTILKGWSAERNPPKTAQSIFQDVRACKSIADAQRLIHSFADAPVNNSWVGTSKVLHFINPDTFPIWDSKIAKKFGLNHRHQFNRREAYVTYLSYMLNAHRSADVSAVIDAINDRYDYRPSKLRCMELVLFSDA